MLTDTKVKCSACLKNYATQKNYKRFHNFWCDECVDKAKQEIIKRSSKTCMYCHEILKPGEKYLKTDINERTVIHVKCHDETWRD